MTRLTQAFDQRSFSIRQTDDAIDDLIGHVRMAILTPADSLERFDFFVVRAQVFVPQGPGLADAVHPRSIQLMWRQPPTLTAPQVAAPTQDTRADPDERIVWVGHIGMLQVIDP